MTEHKTITRAKAAPVVSKAKLPIPVLVGLFLLLLPYYAVAFRSDVLDGETVNALFKGLASIQHPTFALWFGGPFIRPIPFNVLALTSYGLFGVNAFGWHLMVVVGYLAIAFLLLRLFLRLSGSVLAAALGAGYWGLHYAHNHVLLVTNGGNFIHLFAFLFSLDTLLTYTESKDRRYLLLSVLAYLVALFSNDIAPLFIAVYFVFLVFVRPLESFGRRVIAALRDACIYALVSIPYFVIMLTKLEAMKSRDAAHRIHLDLPNFINTASLYVHWLPQTPSPSWQDAFYRISPLHRYTVVMYFLAAIVVLWVGMALFRAAGKKVFPPQQTLVNVFMPLTLCGLLIFPYCFGEIVPHYYILLALIFYSYLFGLAISTTLTAAAGLLGHRSSTVIAVAGAWAVLGFLSLHAYRQVSCFYRNPAAPTGHLLINDTAVHDVICRHYRNTPATFDYVFSNLDAGAFSYHFQNGRWFRMYRDGFAPVQTINDPNLKDPEALRTAARQTARAKGIDKTRLLVLYFKNALFSRDLTDDLTAELPRPATASDPGPKAPPQR